MFLFSKKKNLNKLVEFSISNRILCPEDSMCLQKSFLYYYFKKKNSRLDQDLNLTLLSGQVRYSSCSLQTYIVQVEHIRGVFKKYQTLTFPG